MSLSKDLNYGLNKELSTQKQIEEWIGSSITKTDTMNHFDFKVNDKKILIELKSRRVNKDRYDTTIIGKNKIDYAMEKYNEGYELYFCFNFTDGLYYFKFDKSLTGYPSRF